ncbi:MAG: phage tail tape measure protein [Phyllobacteriaceae bacterium]|nr:phage tail tape measure protein [Phyllobacteriaceae bacterium]
MGGLLAGLSFAGPANEAAAFDQVLRDTAVTAEIATTEVSTYIETTTALYESLALATGQFSRSIGDAAGQLKAAGMDDALIDQMLAPISRVATATSSEITDIASVAFALSDALEVPADRMEDALGQLVIAGKEGRFELKEMAKFFPALTAQMQKLGVTGHEAVAVLGAGLQIAMKGAADPAQAANNFRNFLAKIASPDTIKRFKEAGVDIVAVMQDAVSKGINPVEAVIAKTQDLTGVGADAIRGYMEQAEAMGLSGADALDHVRESLEKIGGAERLSQLFGDQQVLDFLIPMMANLEEYKRIRDAVAAGDRSVIGADFATQMEGPQRQRLIFNEIMTQQSRDLGDAYNAWLPTVNGLLLNFTGYLAQLDSDLPGVRQQALSMAAAASIVAAGLGALGFVLPLITAGLGLLGSAAALMLSPVGLAIGLLAWGAAEIYKRWDDLAPWFEKQWDRLSDAGRHAWRAIRRRAASTWRWMRSTWTQLAPVIGAQWRRMRAIAADAWQGVRSSAAGAYGYLSDTSRLEAWSAKVTGIVSDLRDGLSELGNGARAGFADQLPGIFERWGGAADQLGELGRALGRLLGSLKGLAGLIAGDEGSLEAVGEWFGRLAGGIAKLTGGAIEAALAVLTALVEGVTALSNWAQGQPIDWERLLGSGADVLQTALDWLRDLDQLLRRLSGFEFSLDWSNAIKWPDEPAWFAWVRNRLGREAPEGTILADPTGPITAAGKAPRLGAANQNDPMPQLDLPAGVMARMAGDGVTIGFEPQQHDVNVATDHNVNATIKVDGPGRVVQQSVTRTGERIDTGRAVVGP